MLRAHHARHGRFRSRCHSVAAAFKAATVLLFSPPAKGKLLLRGKLNLIRNPKLTGVQCDNNKIKSITFAKSKVLYKPA